MKDVTSCIYNVPIFRQLPPEAVGQLRRAMVHRRLQPGEVCVHAGDVVEHLTVVHEGLLRLRRIGWSGREQVLRELAPGQFYGEIGLFADVVSEGDLVAVRETEACVLDRAAVQRLMTGTPEMTVPLVRALARRLYEAERAVGELALYDVRRRLAAELLREAAHASGLDALGADMLLRGEASLTLASSWAQLAAKLGTTPESLSRKLHELGEADLVRVDGRRVTIPDAQALRETLYDEP